MIDPYSKKKKESVEFIERPLYPFFIGQNNMITELLGQFKFRKNNGKNIGIY